MMQYAKKLQMLVCCVTLVCVASAATHTAKEQLVSQLSSAAAAGNLALAQAVQKQLVTTVARHRRRLQQPGPPKAICTPALAADGITPLTIQPMSTCAEPQCQRTNTLAVQGGAVVCKFTATPRRTVIRPFTDVFGQFIDYDDVLWKTDGDSVLAGGSANTKTVRTNRLNTKVGAVGSENNIKSTTDLAAIPIPFIGMASNVENTLNVLNTNYGVDSKAPLKFTGAETTGFSSKGSYGSYLPGTVATARAVKDGGSDDNTVFPVRGVFGKH